jgi:hypothetical protein
MRVHRHHNEWGFAVLGKQMVVLSPGEGGSEQDMQYHGMQSHGAFDLATLDRHYGAFGRMAVAASLGLCILGGMVPPADASHRRSHAEAGKPEAPKQLTGPLLLAISISNQRVTIYDNGTPVASSQISTGMSGHPTPMGVFSVIQKQRWHHSNLYSNAPMPYMQRITWSGVALHEGVVPGYPASHGCIRLPGRFALRLWGMTKVGARVVITRGETTPYVIDHPHLAALVKPPEAPPAPPSDAKPDPDGAKPEGADIGPGAIVVATTGAVSAADTGHSDAEHSATAPPQGATDPGAAPAAAQEAPPPPGEDVLHHSGQLSLFVSRREGKLFVRKGFTPAFSVPITIAQPDKPLGTHVFTASPGGDGIRWLGVSLGYDRQPGGSGRGKHKGRTERERPAPVTAESLHRSAADALDRIELPPEVLARLMPLVTPGTSLMISDQGLGGETGKDTDFIVVTK